MWPRLSWRRSRRLLASNQAQSCSTTLRILPSPEPCAWPILRIWGMGLDAVPPAEGAVLGAVIACVGVQLGDGGADDLGQVQEMPEDARIMDVGGRGNGAQREAVGRDETWYLVPGLPRSVGLGPVNAPPCLARTEQLSTTTSQEAISGPARPIRIRAR